jgi:hypothetical protein
LGMRITLSMMMMAMTTTVTVGRTPPTSAKKDRRAHGSHGSLSFCPRRELLRTVQIMMQT